MQKIKLVLIYCITSIIWIFGTNFLTHQFIPPTFIPLVERSKEIFYVVVTAAFIYFINNKNKQLQESREDQNRLSTLINSMVDFVIFKDHEGKWIEANEFGLRLFKLEHVDYRKKKDSELAQFSEFYGEALRCCEKSDEEAWQNRKITRIEEVLLMEDGTTKTFDTIKVPLFYPDGSREGLVIIGRDITEKIEMEKRLTESQQRYKSLFDYSPDIVYMMDLEGNITNLNPHFEINTGYKHSDLIGKNVSSLLSKKDSRYLHKFISSVVQEQKPANYEISIPDVHGKMIILQCTAQPININGNITGIIGYAKDITSIRDTEERLRRTEKLSVVGELSASVAHEIRNPLTSLKGFVQLLQTEDTRHQFYYEIMLDELNRINHIVGELLLLAKPQHMKFTQASVQKLLHDVISLLNTEASLYNVQIHYDFPEIDLEIECEPNQFKQLFINIIKNGIEASQNGGTVFLTLERLETSAMASITIRDNGCGISKERLKRIGEPFYSSKEKGTGLGLTVSYKIVQSHHGTIVVESQKNHGTTVKVQLPISQNITS
ncbi:PAS domain-containing sensor histidine kinase [Bacillus sp. JJ1764]|uniref:PAS domain-containing sensor histidine kinase n=1 Tax=Bacillus sp. JJ1764 TaxID=3122964 RepID=UPI002FFFDA4C